MSNVTTTQNNQPAVAKNIQQLLQSDMVKGRLQEILGKRASTFATSLIQISNSSDMLKKAEPTSLLNAALLATTLDLPLNNSLGHAWIVPFNNKQKDGTYRVEAQFQIGFKGLKNLAIRSGQFKELVAKAVYEGQVVDDDSFLGYKFDWKNKSSDKVIGYASYFKLISGFESTFYMTVEELEAHGKKYSQTFKKYGSGLWKDDFDKMCLKTISKLHLNSGEAPLSIEMRSAVTADQSVVKNYDGEETIDVDYVDNTQPQKVEISDEEKAIAQFKEVLLTISNLDELKSMEESSDTFTKEEMALITAKRKELTKK